MPQSDRLFKRTWWFAAMAVVLYCLLSFFFWSVIDAVTFFGPILWLAVLAVALAAVVMAIILPFRRWRTRRVSSLLPLAFLAACFLITRFIDFTELWLAANFRLHLPGREQVVKRIKSGELRPHVSHSASHNASLIALPGEFASVSKGGGDVTVQRDGERLMILFFTYRGVIDSMAGFVYTSDGSPPKVYDFGGRLFLIRKIQDGWFYVSAH